MRKLSMRLCNTQSSAKRCMGENMMDTQKEKMKLIGEMLIVAKVPLIKAWAGGFLGRLSYKAVKEIYDREGISQLGVK